MQHISSSQNSQYKQLKALATQPKARREAGQTLLEGVHLAQSYFEKGFIPKLGVVSEADLGNSEVTAIVDRLGELEVECVSVTAGLYKSLSAVKNGLGVILLIDTPEPEAYQRLQGDALLLDRVQDPGNLGAILRTAAAAGLGSIYCSPGTASAWSPKVLRAGMGAHFSLDIYEGVDLASVIESSKVPVFATTLQAETTIYEASLVGQTAWLMGNEGQGVDPGLLQLAVQEVTIPQAPQVESLNVAAAIAVCLFEQVRQRSVGS